MSANARSAASINGNSVEVRRGETILSAASAAGIEIPTLCHADGIEAEGGCRMCLVEIEGQRMQAACHTPLMPGMVIRTHTPRLVSLRRELLELTIAAMPDGHVGPDAGGSKFERLLDEHGIVHRPCENAMPEHDIDASHPYMRFDRNKCITCRLCLNACEQIQGQFVYGVEGRGGGVRLIYGPTDRFAESECVACGACVDVCPTGAITDRDRIAPVTHDVERGVDSVCGYCGVGCRAHVEAGNGVVLRIRGVPLAQVNRGHLCVKGRYAHAYHQSPDRLTRPLVRDSAGVLRETGWDEAISFVARRLKEIKDRVGPDALGTMTSSRSTNEAAYLLQKLFRTEIGTNNTDCCARICHSSTAVALSMVTGTGAATASYADIDEAGMIVVAGANPTEAHPVVGARIKQARLRGAELVVIDPRRTELASYASMHLQLWPGTNVAMFNALAKVMIQEGLFDSSYVDSRCEGFAGLASFLAGYRLDDLAALTRVPAADIQYAARLMARSAPGLFVSGLGLSEQTQGVGGVMAYCNLGLLTGSLGKRGAGMLPLRGQNNVQGNADMGSQPYSLTAYLKLGDPVVERHLRECWGIVPPREPGKTIPEMYDAAIAGTLKGLWIQGEDVVQSDPNTSHVVRALKSLDLLIVQELFMTETAKLAHVVFPAAAVLEQEGTFTNGERRVQHVRPAVLPPGQARPDWEVIRDVAAAMSGGSGRWQYPDPSSVMDEVARVAPSLFGGISYARLSGDGLQWPCPDDGHPGSRTVHGETFVRGKAAMMSVEYVPPKDSLNAEFPFVLITGRVLDHYNVGTMTRRTPSRDIVGRDMVEIHPDDAERAGIRDEGAVRVRSRWGEAFATARVSRRVMQGTCFMSFHFPETHTNCVVGPHVDPTSKCPDYKVIAATIEPAYTKSN